MQGVKEGGERGEMSWDWKERGGREKECVGCPFEPFGEVVLSEVIELV